jgi:hypothetical protein
MSPQFLMAAAICVFGAGFSYMAQGDQVGFWRGWWIGTRWAYTIGASVFLVLSALRLR